MVVSLTLLVGIDNLESEEEDQDGIDRVSQNALNRILRTHGLQ